MTDSEIAKFSFRAELRYILLLGFLVPLAFVPSLILGISSNPLAIVSGLAIAHGGVTAGFPWLDPNTGFTTQALGRLSAQDWLHGVVPWWNPYMGGGLPLAGEMQSGSLFLPFVLLLHFSNGTIYLKIALQILAGIGTYLLLRQLGLGRFASFVGGALYELNGAFAWFGHGPIMPIAFLPFLLLGIERTVVFARQGRHGGWLFITGSIAYSLYAGFPETAFLDGLLALAWAIYRLVSAPGVIRLGIAKKVIAGGVFSLLLAAPVLLPFFEYQFHSAITHAGFAHIGLPASSSAMILMPYIFGPLFTFNTADPNGELASNWNIGGYIGLTVLFLSIVSLWGGKKDRGLRLLLATFAIVFVARTLNVPGMQIVFSVIPGIDLVAVYRYCEPIWEMAGAILAAYALDDWRRSAVEFRRVVYSMVVSVLIAGLCLWCAWPLMSRLLHSNRHHYNIWSGGSLLWAVLFLVAVAHICARFPNRRRTVLLGTLVITDAMALYMFPLLSGRRNVSIDLGAVHFLQQHLGLQRFYTFGPIGPNYGSYFEIASINHNAVPVSGDWMRYVKTSLDPGIVDPSIFVGDQPSPKSERERVFRTHLHEFEATAVKYVVATPQSDPFTDSVILSMSGPGGIRVPLQTGEQISGTLPRSLPKNGLVSKAGVVISTYGGKFTGSLEAKICAGSDCAIGTTSLADAPDNNRLEIVLSHPLSVRDAEPVTYTFTHLAGNHELGLWLWPASAAKSDPITAPHGQRLAYAPEVWLGYVSDSVQPKLVYRNRTADIFELPQPAAYFETKGGSCQLSTETRNNLHAVCQEPALLIRRELSYPGWHAFVNGKETAFLPSDSIFQTIPLPKGDLQISFGYRPSYIGWAYVAFLIGLTGVLWALITSFRTVVLSPVAPAGQGRTT